MSIVNYPPEFDEPDDHPTFEEPVCEPDEHWFMPSNYCGVRVCAYCGDHDGLARCYCGWARDGGDGRRQLEEAGEVIEEW